MKAGVVFETDPLKSAVLAKQRPSWAVYETGCEYALSCGTGRHLTINVLDLDPYGDPWPAVDAFFESERPHSARLIVVVNDGLRRTAQRAKAWSSTSLQEKVLKYGNENFFKRYLAVCRELLSEKAAPVGYRLVKWAGYYCGAGQQMTHYAAVLER